MVTQYTILRKLYYVLLLVVSAEFYSIIFSMNPQTLDNLPSEMIGLVAEQLVKIIGTPEIVNQKDLPILLKNLKRLILINKNIYTALNNEHILAALITAIAHRFRISPLEVVEKIGTPQANAWINKSIYASQDYRQFLVFQKIKHIMHEVWKSAYEQRLARLPNRNTEFNSVERHRQTKKGFFLAFDKSQLSSLYTPWGNINLPYNLKNEWYNSNILIMQLLFKRIETVFAGVVEFGINSVLPVTETELVSDLDTVPILDMTFEQRDAYDHKASNNWKVLTRDELVQREGKKCFVTSSGSGNRALYAILSIDNEKIEAADYSIAEHRSSTMLSALFTRMQKIHARIIKEKSIEWVDCCNYPQVRNEIFVKHSCIYCYTDNAQVACDICKKSYYCSQACKEADSNIHIILCRCLQVKTLEELPEIMVFLVQQLIAQKDFDFSGKDDFHASFLKEYNNKSCIKASHDTVFKILWLADYTEHRIVSLMHECVPILHLGNSLGLLMNFCYYVECYKNIAPRQGITLSADSIAYVSEVDSLSAAYKRIVQLMQSDWVASRLVDYPNIGRRESEEEWVLFTKKSCFFVEDTLIRFLVSKFGMDNKVICDNEWQTDKGSTEIKSKNIYLWIKKDSLEEFKRVFNFDLQQLSITV